MKIWFMYVESFLCMWYWSYFVLEKLLASWLKLGRSLLSYVLDICSCMGYLLYVWGVFLSLGCSSYVWDISLTK